MAEWIVEITDGLPHIRRMTELVRCKDCKWMHYYGFNLEYTECEVHDRGVHEDDYYSWAIRRERKYD